MSSLYAFSDENSATLMKKGNEEMKINIKFDAYDRIG